MMSKPRCGFAAECFVCESRVPCSGLEMGVHPRTAPTLGLKQAIQMAGMFCSPHVPLKSAMDAAQSQSTVSAGEARIIRVLATKENSDSMFSSFLAAISHRDKSVPYGLAGFVHGLVTGHGVAAFSNSVGNTYGFRLGKVVW